MGDLESDVKNILIISDGNLAVKTGVYDDKKITAVEYSDLRGITKNLGDMRYSDCVVLLDQGDLFVPPYRYADNETFLFELGLIDRARLLELQKPEALKDPEYESYPFHYAVEVLSPDYGPHCIKRHEDGTREWVGSRDGARDDPWLSRDRLLITVAARLCEIFRCGLGAEPQEVWVLLSQSEHPLREDLIKEILGRRAGQSAATPCAAMPAAVATDKHLLSLIRNMDTKWPSMLLRDVPSASGHLGLALGEGTQWRTICTKSGITVGFEATVRQLRTVWVDISAAFQTQDGKSSAVDCFLGTLGIPTDTSRHSEAQAFLQKCRTAKQRVDEILRSKGAVNPLVGESAEMLRLYPEILKVATARTPQNICVVGESGTGKEKLCELLALFAPDSGSVVAVEQSLLDAKNGLADLFGIEEGAYTGVQKRDGYVHIAGEGTLVFDGLEDFSDELQVRLKRFLDPDKREYQVVGDPRKRAHRAKCQIVCCFNRRPEDLYREGRLKEDFFRRWPIRIDLPPLDQRREDIPALVDLCVEQFVRDEHVDDAILDSIRPSASIVKKWQSKTWSAGPWDGKEKGGNVGGLFNAVKGYLRERLLEAHSNGQSTAHQHQGLGTVQKTLLGRPAGIDAGGFRGFIIDAIAQRWSLAKLKEKLAPHYQKNDQLLRRARTVLGKSDEGRTLIQELSRMVDADRQRDG